MSLFIELRGDDMEKMVNVCRTIINRMGGDNAIATLANSDRLFFDINTVILFSKARARGELKNEAIRTAGMNNSIDIISVDPDETYCGKGQYFLLSPNGKEELSYVPKENKAKERKVEIGE